MKYPAPHNNAIANIIMITLKTVPEKNPPSSVLFVFGSGGFSVVVPLPLPPPPLISAKQNNEFCC